MVVDDDAAPRVSQVALGPDVAERDDILRAFGRNLKKYRVAAGLTQVTLSERCFLGCERVSLLERGKLAPSLLVLLMLSDALGVAVGELVEGVGAPSRRRSRLRVGRLIDGNPGISTGEIADALNLPYGYVFQDVRCMFSLGEISGRSRSWQPTLGLRARSR
jgi:transcriptional regulator with XRE-family HTH domain